MTDAWYLESIAADGSHVTQPIRGLPFRVGRDTGNDLVVDARGLSRLHAVIDADASGRLQVTDLGSTNGTFVNRERISGARLLAGDDVIHFGNAEFRLGRDGGPGSARPVGDGQRTMIVAARRGLSRNFVRHEREFMQLLGGQGISAMVQPIVGAVDGQVFAYELLGRCTHPELPNSPTHLFQLAAMLGREAELSAAFRKFGVAQAAPRLKGARLFVNTHPEETFTDDLFDWLAHWRAQPDAPLLVVEVHETAVVEVGAMRALAARLQGIGVLFAYDDFGAGQARLRELAEVPPHFVKFDMGLLHGIDQAPEGRQHMVRELVRLVLDLGSVPLAEGIETEAEAAVCRDMGFQLVQGYLTGRPVDIGSV
ncbi:MAG: diguanylate phosphodiesterase [Leptothrix sp. (in: Bacteria)]|nr:diguanylate phosphodiesterase [Leptothrix sp. (in: b-proteobacteria)]